MGEYSVSSSTTTSMNDDSTLDYSVNAKALDWTGSKEYEWSFTDAAKNFGYYKTIPELKKAVDALATWTTGKGWRVESVLDKITIEHIDGWGEDTFDSILWNMIVTKKVVGDAFAEIIRENGQIINLKPISPERMKIILNDKGRILRYEHNNLVGNWKPLKRNQVLHLCNDRIGDEIHGTSVIDACKWVIEARNEAMDTYRKVLKRSLALGVLYVDTDDQTKISEINEQYKNAIKNGEVLTLPKDVAELRDAGITIKDYISWISYLENFFYQAVGIPKIILGGSADYTEASSKVGYLTFEQVYAAEQRLLEQDIWAQLGIKITFERPVSLKEDLNNGEAKNTGQLGIQPAETMISPSRSE
jgi:hypothetical protein